VLRALHLHRCFLQLVMAILQYLLVVDVDEQRCVPATCLQLPLTTCMLRCCGTPQAAPAARWQRSASRSSIPSWSAAVSTSIAASLRQQVLTTKTMRATSDTELPLMYVMQAVCCG
jgi:hypothetical protein